MMMKLACDEFFGVVVNVGWKQLTGDFSAHDIGECSQVKWETRRYVNASKPTLAAFENIIWTNVGDVEVGEFVSLKFGVSHSSICASVASFTTKINDLNCRGKEIESKVQLWKLEGKLKQNGMWLKWRVIVTRREKRYPQNHLTRRRVSTIQADACLVQWIRSSIFLLPM